MQILLINNQIKNKKILRNCSLICLLVVLVCIGSIFSPKASAQEVRTFTIVPPSIQQTLDPGGIKEGVMKVINDSSEPLIFTASVQDYIVEDSKGTPKILPPNVLSNKYSASSWIGVSPSTFTIPPHEKQILNYYMQIPRDAAPGGHYAAVIFNPANATGVEGTGASVETQLGTLFYISINGQINEFSKITRFFANTFQEYGPVKIQTQIKNLGDLHIKPTGAIKVADSLGRTIQTEKLSGYNIFPSTARDYENTFGQKIMIGRYKASAEANYGRNNKLPLIATLYFWVFPWKIALVGILAIIAIILGVITIKKKAQKELEKKAEEI